MTSNKSILFLLAIVNYIYPIQHVMMLCHYLQFLSLLMLVTVEDHFVFVCVCFCFAFVLCVCVFVLQIKLRCTDSVLESLRMFVCLYVYVCNELSFSHAHNAHTQPRNTDTSYNVYTHTCAYTKLFPYPFF